MLENNKVFQWIWETRVKRIALIVILSVLTVHLWLTWRIHRFVDHFCKATITAKSLSHPDIVFVYDDLLAGPIANELSLGYKISTRPYDACEFEFLRCTHSAFIRTANHRTGLRLRFDLFRNQFHVVGYWTVE
jgi:hypothetical protein